MFKQEKYFTHLKNHYSLKIHVNTTTIQSQKAGKNTTSEKKNYQKATIQHLPLTTRYRWVSGYEKVN